MHNLRLTYGKAVYETEATLYFSPNYPRATFIYTVTST